MDPDNDNRFTTNSFYGANIAMGIIGVISVWFIPLLRRENRNSKIVVFFASEVAILLINVCPTKHVSTVNADVIITEVSVLRNLQNMNTEYKESLPFGTFFFIKTISLSLLRLWEKVVYNVEKSYVDKYTRFHLIKYLL